MGYNCFRHSCTMARRCGGTGVINEATEEVQNLVDRVREAVGLKVKKMHKKMKATHFKTQEVRIKSKILVLKGHYYIVAYERDG